MRHLALPALLALLGTPLAARAQQLPNPYGSPVGVEAARKVAAAALAEARKNGWTMAVAVVEPAGDLVYYEKMDNTQLGSSEVAIAKARASARFKRPTKAFEDAVNGGHPNTLALPGVIASEGGVPLVVDGKIVGAVGVSGGASPQDGVCAKAGAEVLAVKTAAGQ